MYKHNFCNKLIQLVVFACIIVSKTFAQTTFPVGSGQSGCSTVTPVLAPVTAPDGVIISPVLRLEAPCLDNNLNTTTANQPASSRTPMFCYDNRHFPIAMWNTLSIVRTSTANAGSCAYQRSVVKASFTEGTNVRPKGLTFTIVDIDNPYDSIEVVVYAKGIPVTYAFAFGDPNPATSYAWSGNTTGSGTVVQFNGGANGVWGESNFFQNNPQGRINFTVDATTPVDSIVVSHIMRNDRPDQNPTWSMGNFRWTSFEVLPVKLSSFTAVKQNEGVLLQWTTGSELNNKGFEIEKSADGQVWNNIGFIPAATINSTATQSYKFTDVAIKTAKNYYRLKQVDQDNKFVYSEVLIVKYGDFSINVFPNPANDKITIAGVEPGSTITIINHAGSLVLSQKILHSSTVLDISRFKAGVYFVKVQVNNEATVLKLVKK